MHFHQLTLFRKKSLRRQSVDHQEIFLFKAKKYKLPIFFTAVARYWYGMSTEEFDCMVIMSYENGKFTPKYDDEMKILRESQLRQTKKHELAVSQAQCQGECHS